MKKHTHRFWILCLAAMIALGFPLSGCGKTEPVSGDMIWNCLGIKQSDLIEISLEYAGGCLPEESRLSVTPEECKEWLALLSTAGLDYTEPENETERLIYTPAMFTVTFRTNETTVSPEFFWFGGMFVSELSTPLPQQEGPPQHVEYLDNRFDIVLDGVRYVFRYDTSMGFWTEQQMQHEYERLSGILGGKTIEELEGVDQSYAEGRVTVDSFEAETILEEAENVVIARAYEPLVVQGWPAKLAMCFVVEKSLKGSVPKGEKLYLLMKYQRYLLLPEETGEKSTLTQTYGTSIAPKFIPGESYLLAVSEVPERELPCLLEGPFGAAHLVDGVLYPAYNSEHHPFYGMTIEEVEKHIKSGP